MKVFSIFRRMLLWEANNNILKTAKQVGKGFVNNSIASCVNEKTEIGDNVSFNGLRVIGHGKVTIGDFFHCAEGCYIITDNHDYDEGRELPYDHERSIPQEVIIEECVWLGTNVIILPGAYICEGAIIQAGSVVTGRIEKGGIAGGHPAKVFKFRNMEHYAELKEKNAYVLNQKK